MNAEEFDDALRRRLEGYNAPHQPQEVERVLQQVKKQRLPAPSAGLSRKSRWAFAASIGLIISLTVLNLLQLNENKNLRDLLTSRSESNALPMVHDTVFVHTASVALPSGARGETVLASTPPAAHESAVGAGHRASGASSSPSSAQGKKPFGRFANRPSAGTSLSDVNGGGAEAEEDFSSTTSSASSSSPASVLTLRSFLPKGAVALPENHRLAYLQAPYSSDQADVAINPKAVYPDVPKTRTWPQVYVGVRCAPSPSRLTLGLSATVMLGRNWSALVGLAYANSDRARFANARDMDDFNGNGPHLPRPAAPIDSSARGIDLQTQTLQIPLRIQYHQALSKGFGLTFGAGTDLDVRSWQRVAFRRPEEAPGPPSERFLVNQPVRMMTSATATAGLDWRSNRWWLSALYQVNPSLSKSVARPEPVYHGFEVRAAYRL